MRNGFRSSTQDVRTPTRISAVLAVFHAACHLRPTWDMSPGGHLVITAAACAATQTMTGSWPLTAAVAAGGFLIDIDHAVDYVLFERSRRLTPGAFLRHYVEGRTQRVVLALHSYELFAALLLAGWWTASVPLLGYLVGGLLHLALDVIWNGQLTPRSIGAFYSFTYRAWHRFDSARLLGTPTFAPMEGFWAAFFCGSVPVADAREDFSPSPARPLANLSS